MRYEFYRYEINLDPAMKLATYKRLKKILTLVSVNVILERVKDFEEFTEAFAAAEIYLNDHYGFVQTEQNRCILNNKDDLKVLLIGEGYYLDEEDV